MRELQEILDNIFEKKIRYDNQNYVPVFRIKELFRTFQVALPHSSSSFLKREQNSLFSQSLFSDSVAKNGIFLASAKGAKALNIGPPKLKTISTLFTETNLLNAEIACLLSYAESSKITL